MKDRIKGIFLRHRNVIVAAALALIAAANCALLGYSGAYAVYYSSPMRKLPIYCVETPLKRLSVSFDCAWGTEFTYGILDVLDEYGVHATFFMTQFWVEKYPEAVAEIHRRGHEIGTHSATHSYMSKQSEAQITGELESSAKAIEDIINERLTLFRAPFGDYDDLLIECAERRGLFTIQWDVDSLDWKGISSGDISSRVLSKAKNGSIVLFHNNADHTLEALPLIFVTLQNKGYEFVPIGELIYKEKYKLDNSGRQIPDTEG